jgi:DNA-binding LacI/PurR family transcriptional regulator
MRAKRRRVQPPSRRRTGRATVTLGDVARAARVATSTVSRALTGDPRISPPTRRAVERVARRLGYSPNALARGLAGGGTDVLAVVIPRTAEYTFTSPFHLAALKGISRVLQEAGQLMLLSFLEERDYVALHRSGLCRGVIVLMSRIGDRRIAALAKHRVPAVLIPGDPSLPGVASLTFDVAAGTAAATRHLLELGHSRIAFIGGVPSSLLHRDRLAAFRRALAAAGVTTDPRLEAETNFTASEAHDRALEFLGRADRPTALLCSNEVMAEAAQAAAQKLGLRVPADVSLVGLAGLPGPRLAAPAIATVIVDYEQVGATAATMLLKQIADKSSRGSAGLLPVEFDPGGSTAPPPARRPGDAGGGTS